MTSAQRVSSSQSVSGSSPKTKIHLVPAHRADIPAIVNLTIEAHERDLVFQLNNPNTAGTRQKFIKRVGEIWEKVHAWIAVELPAEDSEEVYRRDTVDADLETYGGGVDGKTIGLLMFHATWEKEGPSVSQSLMAGHVLSPDPSTVTLSRAASNTTDTSSTTLTEAIIARFNTTKAPWLTHKSAVYVLSLGVSPHYQRQGIGSALLKIATDYADNARVASYLEATPAGYPLYSVRGFNTVESMDFDLSQWAGEDKGFGVYRYRAMLRLPAQVDEPERR